MNCYLEVRRDSERKGYYRRDNLLRLAQRILAGEAVAEDVEVSVLFCDDPFIAELNKTYRKHRGPTDVLSFEQEGHGPQQARILGDIVISLETVERFCNGDAAAMRDEVRLLFCHGMLHLLGYDHITVKERREMQERQARYLGCDPESAWRHREKEQKTGV